MDKTLSFVVIGILQLYTFKGRMIERKIYDDDGERERVRKIVKKEKTENEEIKWGDVVEEEKGGKQQQQNK